MEDNNPPENRYNDSRHSQVPDKEICEFLREKGHPTHGIVIKRNPETAQLDGAAGKQGYERKKNRNRKLLGNGSVRQSSRIRGIGLVTILGEFTRFYEKRDTLQISIVTERSSETPQSVYVTTKQPFEKTPEVQMRICPVTILGEVCTFLHENGGAAS
jgi:hypothetical protein